MRIKDKIENISYVNTLDFFESRVKKYSENNPYSVTMYQDEHPDLVKQRNLEEIKKLKPLLLLDKKSRILDVSCGIGRWSDAINTEIEEYCGVDFCSDFIELAKERNGKDNRFFYVSENTKIEQCMNRVGKKNFNRVLLVGALMYLNDADVQSTLMQIERLCNEHAIICVREPIGIDERLTLKDQFSNELQDDYNAIYRTKEELEIIFKKTLANKGFSVAESDFMYKQKELNNRKETTQFYWILKR